MANLSVIIVNWNTKELLGECLRAVYAGIDEPGVIVVDNGSTDGTLDMLKDRFPAARVIANSENLGFGTANNQAIQAVAGMGDEYLLFLNTDAVINRQAIRKMREFMDSHPEAGLCTGTLLRADGSVQDTFGPYPSLATELFGRSLLKLFSPSKYTPRALTPGHKTPRRVASIRGACMMARREAVSGIGGFNERYFLFMEETDFCLRLNKKGYQVWWLPGVTVYHRGGGSAGAKVPGARIEYWRSRYRFFHKNYPAWKCAILRFGLLFKLVIDWVLNLAGSIATPAREKFRSYSVLILWHILGCPGDWGLTSGKTVKTDKGLVRAEFTAWWKENEGEILSAGKVIKDSAARSLTDYKGEVYVKRYKARQFLLREWRLISRLRQLGIPTVMPVAAGRGYLVTERLKDVENLHDFMLKNLEKLTFREKLDLTCSFAGFIGKLHRKGLCHKDLHAGNILVRYPGSGPAHFYITDLHRARLGTWLSKREILRSLVQLNVFFSLQISRTWRLRFFKRYISGIPDFRDYKRYARIIEIRANCACRRLWQKRDRLYLKKKKYGIRKRYNGIDYIINPQYAGIDPGRITPYLRPGGEGVPLKDSRSSYLKAQEVPGLGKVVLKIYRQKRFINYVKDIWRPSRAFRAWEGSWALVTRQIATPEPILAAERRRFGILAESLIVNRGISDSENLTLWINKNWKDRPPAFKEGFIDKLACFVRRIHNRGLHPADLKASNILVKEDEAGVRFYLIDLDHLRKKNYVSLNRRLYNISQLNRSFPDTGVVSATMRWRFLRGYFYGRDIDERKKIAGRLGDT